MDNMPRCILHTLMGVAFISCLNDTMVITCCNGLNGNFRVWYYKRWHYYGVGHIVVAASAGANYMYDLSK